MATEQTEPPRTHEQSLAYLDKVHDINVAQRQQLARILVIMGIVAAWLWQTVYVTLGALRDPLILVDIEKFTGLIAVTGAVATVIIMKLWPQNDK